MNWWQILILCWACAAMGYFVAALMFLARANSDVENQPLALTERAVAAIKSVAEEGDLQ